MDFTVDLEGRVAVVTGAAGGIGRAVALQLASSGADVAVTDIHQRVEPLCELAAEISAMGRKSIATTADVTDRTDIDQLIGDVLNAFGAVDLLVNGASVLYPTIQLDSSQSARELVAAVIDTENLNADDVVEVDIAVNPGTGTLGKGVFAMLDIHEKAE